jgi:hypothetical protein
MKRYATIRHPTTITMLKVSVVLRGFIAVIALTSFARALAPASCKIPSLEVQRYRTFAPVSSSRKVPSSTIAQRYRPHDPHLASTPCYARRRDDDDDDGEDDDDDDFFDDDDDYYYEERPRRRRIPADELGEAREGRQDSGLNVPSGFGRRAGWRLPDSVSKALLAGVFILGVGMGVTVDSAINTNPRDLASRDAIDQAAPNPNLCASYGASAMAFDQRVFVSFNPFNVYVAQADVKPACVLRSSNAVPILQGRKLINDREVRACKQNIDNTWAFVGDLEHMPQLSCVYKSEDAQNEFLSDPKLGIGEDVWDDDRGSNRKNIKGSLTEAQKDLMRGQAKSAL